MPGETIETGETPLEALHKEVYEEADTALAPDPREKAFYQQVCQIENNNRIIRRPTATLHYITRAQRINPLTPDPDGDITEVK